MFLKRLPTMEGRQGVQENKKSTRYWSSCCGSVVTQLVSMRVRSLILLSGLRIWHCRELWCRVQMRLRFCVAVALAEAGATRVAQEMAKSPPPQKK